MYQHTETGTTFGFEHETEGLIEPACSSSRGADDVERTVRKARVPPVPVDLPAIDDRSFST